MKTNRYLKYKHIYKKYYSKNRKLIILRTKKYYLLNRNKMIKKMKEYYKKHRKEILKRIKEYRYKNKIYLNLYNCKRRKIDINFKLKQYLRTRIRLALKNNQKRGHLIDLLGCSIKELKKYLQKQFKKGMNWNNYGKWEIDHIKPCCSFNLSKVSEQKKCFHYTNLQPLWAEDNRRKQWTKKK